jgi:tetratricopeptide (TPR) repeat protein
MTEMNGTRGRLRFVLLLVLGLALSSSAVMAQHAAVKGVVKMEDGSPVAKAVVGLEVGTEGTVVMEAKTKKNGSFILPFVKSGTYKFTAKKEGLLIKSLTVNVLLPNKQYESEYSSDVGALQQLPQFRVGMSRTAEIEFVMVPKNYFAAVMVVPGDAQATAKLSEANDLAIARRFEESSALLMELVEQDKATSKIYYILGSNAFAMDNIDEAAKWFGLTLELDPEQPGLHAHLGSIAHQRGELEQALEEYRKELEISPQLHVLMVNRAVILVELGRTEEAIEAFRKVIETNPGEQAAYSELAGLYLSLGRDEEAAEVLEALEETGEADPALWFNIGAGLSNRDQYDQAEAAYLKALAIDPEFADAIREIGYLLLRKGDQQGALQRFDQYLEMQPDAADVKALRDALAKQLEG